MRRKGDSNVPVNASSYTLKVRGTDGQVSECFAGTSKRTSFGKLLSTVIHRVTDKLHGSGRRGTLRLGLSISDAPPEPRTAPENRVMRL